MIEIEVYDGCCKGSQSDHYVVWLEVSVDITELMNTHHAIDDLLEDSRQMLWISVLLQVLPEVHLELVQREGYVGYPYEDCFKMSYMRELLEGCMREDRMLCYGIALNVHVYEHVFDVEDFVSHTLVGDTILAHIAVHIKRALEGSL